MIIKILPDNKNNNQNCISITVQDTYQDMGIKMLRMIWTISMKQLILGFGQLFWLPLSNLPPPLRPLYKRHDNFGCSSLRGTKLKIYYQIDTLGSQFFWLNIVHAHATPPWYKRQILVSEGGKIPFCCEIHQCTWYLVEPSESG